jgi:hypothetical protein
MQSAFFPPAAQQQQNQQLACDTSHHSRKAAVTNTAGSTQRHHAAGPGSISSQQVGGRAPRFPSSRRYLWDKTAAGPQVLVDALVSQPTTASPGFLYAAHTLVSQQAEHAAFVLAVQDYLPHMQVAASTFGAISKAASSKASSLTLQLGLSVSSSNQVTALIQEHDPLSKLPPAGSIGQRGGTCTKCLLVQDSGTQPYRACMHDL